MRVWSKMTLALAAGAWILPAFPCPAEDENPTPAPKAERPADDAKRPEAKAGGDPSSDDEEGAADSSRPKGPSVELRLVIGGLGSEGCEVEVKPGNPACRFKRQTKRVASDGKLTLVFPNVELRGVDRNCLFTITMREPGQEPKTVHRGFRMSPASAAGSKASPQTFTCFMSSPSKVATLEREGRVVR
jgi:hypothetical protein